MNITLFKIQSRSEEDTVELARDLAEKLVAGDILLFYGDLGMGKSVLARALIKHLCKSPEMEVPSPTFTLVQSYDSPLGEILHFDLYRLCDVSEVYEIGWEEAMEAGEGVVLVEWPERLGALMPESAIHIHITAIDGLADFRNIEVIKYG